MAVGQRRCPDLGEPLTAHWKALPGRQQIVFRSCAEISRRWGAYLAGGTALALQLGHRQSEDLDWFTIQTVAPDDLLVDVHGLGFPTTVKQNDEGTFLATVGDVKFSVFRYRYPMIDSFVQVEGINLASARDLAAMKLAALMGRATKRDYIDVHVLLTEGHLSLPEMVRAFEQKYPKHEVHGALRALTFFDDVEGNMPIMLAPTTWKKVTTDLARLARRYSDRA
jgi:hypothetical protein